MLKLAKVLIGYASGVGLTLFLASLLASIDNGEPSAVAIILMLGVIILVCGFLGILLAAAHALLGDSDSPRKEAI